MHPWFLSVKASKLDRIGRHGFSFLQVNSRIGTCASNEFTYIYFLERLLGDPQVFWPLQLSLSLSPNKIRLSEGRAVQPHYEAAVRPFTFQPSPTLFLLLRPKLAFSVKLQQISVTEDTPKVMFFCPKNVVLILSCFTPH